MMKLLTVVAVLAIAVLASVQLAAHDFWLGANQWRPAAGGSVVITANVGEHFPTATNFTAPERVDQWRVIGPSGDVPVDPATFRRERESLAGTVHLPPQPGSYLVVMTIRARVADMKGEEFTEYLREEGLESVIAERKKAGETDAPGRERYAQYAKVVIRTGAGTSDHITAPAGLRAELVPTVDPSTLRAGDSLTVRLLAGGKPVAGAVIGARHEGAPASAKAPTVVARTGADGRAVLKLDQSGAWLVRTVHMARTTERGDPPADWESYGATLAFQMADARGGRAGR